MEGIFIVRAELPSLTANPLFQTDMIIVCVFSSFVCGFEKDDIIAILYISTSIVSVS